MSANVAIINLNWDLTCLESIAQSQRWILSAMQKHGQDLVSMLWRILGNEQDVCDAYQQTFLQMAHRSDHTKPDNIKAYLFKTSANIAVSMLRYKKSQMKLIQHAASEKKFDFNVNHEQFLDSQYLQEKLRMAISKLPEYLREVIILRELGELSYAEVARILGIKSATARVYRFKAFSLLSEWMAKDIE